MKRSQRIKGQTNKHKIARAVALAIGLLIYPQTIIYAAEPDYSQEITPEMELEGTTGITDSPEENATSRVSVADGIIYDNSQLLYGYNSSTGSGYVYANVLDGMITQNGVQISADDGVSYTLYRDSEPYTPQEDTITEPGSYTVTCGQKGSEQKLLSFTVIGDRINEPVSYAMPTGCIVTEETLDGEDAMTDNRSVDLSEEGHYVISYRCVRNNVEYQLDMTVDHTPPTITADGVKNGKARGPVTLKNMEAGSTLVILKDGQQITKRAILTQPGAYTVKVTDEAGNSNAYSFYILFYLNAGGISFGLILVAVIAALGIYLYVSRRRLRIR